MNGFLNINKPAGMSSAAVVGVLKRLTGEKRVGHAGTLDPEAAGVLPIMLGRATRLFDYLADTGKEYEAVCAFGTATDTQDATGTVTERGDQYPDLARIRREAATMEGDILQRPSMYSAIQVNGERLYALARRGETVEVPERVVHVDSIRVLGEEPDHAVRIRVACGKGTYIRSICDDLGKKCGCPAHMRSLIRIRSGWFSLEKALSLEEAKTLAGGGSLEDRLIPMDAPLAHMPRLDAAARVARKVDAGAKLTVSAVKGDVPGEGIPARIYQAGQFRGIVERRGDELAWRMQIPANVPVVIALGEFDGVHRGHQELIRQGRRLADEMGARLLIFTFDRHPLSVLRPEAAPGMLSVPEEQRARILACGADGVEVLPFTEKTAETEPEAFLADLRGKYRMEAVVVGWNYTFGRMGRGTPEMLRADGEKHGYRVLVVPPVRSDKDEIISSTSIREKLRAGKLEDANEMLGYAYGISGPVVAGKHMGSRIGFPTANIRYPETKLLPAHGVYVCQLASDGEQWNGVVNIGTQPTLPSGGVTVEAHALGAHPELYGRQAEVRLLKRLREEIRFASAQELTRQIERDREAAERWFEENETLNQIKLEDGRSHGWRV